jgi:hypothetical protein
MGAATGAATGGWTSERSHTFKIIGESLMMRAINDRITIVFRIISEPPVGAVSADAAVEVFSNLLIECGLIKGRLIAWPSEMVAARPFCATGQLDVLL